MFYVIIFWVALIVLGLGVLAIGEVSLKKLGVIRSLAGDEVKTMSWVDIGVGGAVVIIPSLLVILWTYDKGGDADPYNDIEEKSVTSSTVRSTNPKTLTQKIAISNVESAFKHIFGFEVKSVYFIEYDDLQDVLGVKKITQWEGVAEIYFINGDERLDCVVADVSDSRKFGAGFHVLDRETVRPCE
jgi:hypothetical protein